MWYIATLVPVGVQRILFLPGSSKGLSLLAKGILHIECTKSVNFGSDPFHIIFVDTETWSLSMVIPEDKECQLWF